MNYNVWQSYCTGCEKPNPHRISFGGVNCFHFTCWLAYLWCGLTLRAGDVATGVKNWLDFNFTPRA